MKLIIMILSDKDADAAIHALIEQQYRVTRIASTGGFLRKGNTTLMIGTELEQVQRALDIVRDACEVPQETGRRRATVFVLDVAEYEQL